MWLIVITQAMSFRFLCEGLCDWGCVNGDTHGAVEVKSMCVCGGHVCAVLGGQRSSLGSNQCVGLLQQMLRGRCEPRRSLFSHWDAGALLLWPVRGLSTIETWLFWTSECSTTGMISCFLKSTRFNDAQAANMIVAHQQRQRILWRCVWATFEAVRRVTL